MRWRGDHQHTMTRHHHTSTHVTNTRHNHTSTHVTNTGHHDMSQTHRHHTSPPHVIITRHHHIHLVHSDSLDVCLHISVPPSIKPRCLVCFPPLLCFSLLLCCSLCLLLLLQVQPAASQWSMHVCSTVALGMGEHTVQWENLVGLILAVWQFSANPPNLNPPKNALSKSAKVCTHQSYPPYSINNLHACT